MLGILLGRGSTDSRGRINLLLVMGVTATSGSEQEVGALNNWNRDVFQGH